MWSGPLLAPLERAATEVDLPQSAREKVQRAVLRVMFERNTGWGSWDAATWLEAAQRAGNYKVSVLDVGARPGVLSGADIVRSCDQPTRLARRLFGRTDLDREVGRVQTHRGLWSQRSAEWANQQFDPVSGWLSQLCTNGPPTMHAVR